MKAMVLLRYWSRDRVVVVGVMTASDAPFRRSDSDCRIRACNLAAARLLTPSRCRRTRNWRSAYLRMATQRPRYPSCLQTSSVCAATTRRNRAPIVSQSAFTSRVTNTKSHERSDVSCSSKNLDACTERTVGASSIPKNQGLKRVSRKQTGVETK